MRMGIEKRLMEKIPEIMEVEQIQDEAGGLDLTEENVEATLDELRQLFPADMEKAKLRKSAVVRVPRSVYAAIPGRNKYRPSQETPISNLVLAGDWTSQKYLGSMEGAILGGKLAAEVR